MGKESKEGSFKRIPENGDTVARALRIEERCDVG